MKPTEVHDQMREEWNERAREDAHYFVAFGRRDQDDEEFFSTGSGLVGELVKELKRLPSDKPPGQLRALEIGCGPGRLLRPMSRFFAEIHGIDVSDEMVALARQKLAGVPNAFPHHAGGSDLAQFPDRYFGFVYSYAVFQHIPSAEVVFSYLRETLRVLEPGGIARLHINGLPKTSKTYTTWEGVRISAAEVRQFAAEQGVELLALTGVDTQYMWTTWRKPTQVAAAAAPTAISAVTNAFSGEQAVPASGRLACAALSIENLPGGADLNSLTVRIDGKRGEACYIGPEAHNHLTQVNVFLPPGVRTGILSVTVELHGKPIAPDAWVRVIPPGPAVPRLTAISDGVNLMSPQHIDSGLMKATLEEVDDISAFAATVDGLPVTGIDTFRTDPLCERWEVNFEIPRKLQHGGHVLDLHLGRRLLTRMGIILSALTLLALSAFAADTPETILRKALTAKTGTVMLPAGVIEISREVTIPADAHDLLVRAKGTTLKASAAFRGRALLYIAGGLNIRVEDLALDGSRDAVGRMASLPPSGTMYARVVANNGIVAEGVTGLEIARVKARNIAGFAVLVNGGLGAKLSEIEVTDSGGYNPQHRNNGAGGIALEEGLADFDVRRCLIGGIRGSAITLRNVKRGVIQENELNVLARDAVTADHVTSVIIRNNRSREIGYPTSDFDGSAVCFRLTASSDNTVEANTCTETLLGAIIVSGQRNRVTANHLTKLNAGHREVGGVFLDTGSSANIVEGNDIAGPGMGNRCVVLGPGVAPNTNRVAKNDCLDEASLALLRPSIRR